MVSGIPTSHRHLWLKHLILCCLCTALGLLQPLSLSATVNSGEIVPGTVTATVSPTIDPVNGVSVVFRWTTLHPSNSYVMIENPENYAGNDNESTRQIFSALLTTNHVVTVDHFPAYDYYGVWGYYVASQQANGTWASYPGPATAGCGTPPLPGCGGRYLSFNLSTTPNNPAGPLIFTLWPVGDGSPPRTHSGCGRWPSPHRRDRKG